MSSALEKWKPTAFLGIMILLDGAASLNLTSPSLILTVPIHRCRFIFHNPEVNDPNVYIAKEVGWQDGKPRWVYKKGYKGALFHMTQCLKTDDKNMFIEITSMSKIGVKEEVIKVSFMDGKCDKQKQQGIFVVTCLAFKNVAKQHCFAVVFYLNEQIENQWRHCRNYMLEVTDPDAPTQTKCTFITPIYEGFDGMDHMTEFIEQNKKKIFAHGTNYKVDCREISRYAVAFGVLCATLFFITFTPLPPIIVHPEDCERTQKQIDKIENKKMKNRIAKTKSKKLNLYQKRMNMR